jgi:hypothetical protein
MWTVMATPTRRLVPGDYARRGPCYLVSSMMAAVVQNMRFKDIANSSNRLQIDRKR